jgi:hypothetical protein
MPPRILKSRSNREEWLSDVASRIEPLFGMKLEPYRLTCGWPSSRGLASSGRVLGECHASKISRGSVCEIFISPTLEFPLTVAGVVCHEMTHVAAGVDAQHRGMFVRMCKHIGLTKGKPTSAMPGDRLEDKIRKILDKSGEYPHQALVPVVKAAKPKSDTTLECEECGCKVRLSVRWLRLAGPPECGCGGRMG